MKISKRVIWSLSAFVLVASVLLVYFKAVQPHVKVKENAYEIAQKYAKIQEPKAFYEFHRQKTYYTVAGYNQKKQYTLAVINQKGTHVTLFRQSKGITKNEALNILWSNYNPKKVYKINFGLFEKKPVWEISYVNKNKELSYILLDFKTGDTTKLIENL